MAKKSAVKFVCSNCGAVSSAWAGRCNVCGEWNTIQEELDVTPMQAKKLGQKLAPRSVAEVAKKDAHQRLASGLAEVDDVLGGGLVAGSVTLIAGQPGIGKSTLLLQLAYLLAAHQPVLYVSGEESRDKSQEIDSRQ